MMTLKFYFYVTSKYPYQFTGRIYQQYKSYRMKKWQNDDFKIEPVINDGIFRITMKKSGCDENAVYDDAIKWLHTFLNFLTLFCKHGFKELDIHFWSNNNADIDEQLHKFEESLENFLSIERQSTSQRRSDNIPNLINEAYQMTQKFSNIGGATRRQISKLDNALSLFRLSYFIPDERIRYVVRFTALECLADRIETKIDKTLISAIKKYARKICDENNVPKNNIDSICSHIGMLKQESIKESINRLLMENNISSSKQYTIDKLYTARNTIVHEGKEILNSNGSQVTHNYCDAIEGTLIQLLQKHIIKT